MSFLDIYGFYQSINSKECNFDRNSFLQFLKECHKKESRKDYFCKFVVAEIMRNLEFEDRFIDSWAYGIDVMN